MSTASPRILVVEDEEDLCDTIVKWLRDEHCVVEAAYDGLDAFTKICSKDYDLIILDLMLPVVGGLDVCYRSRAFGLQTPILIITAHGSPSIKNAALANGANMFMTKPFKLRELSRRINSLLKIIPNTEIEKESNYCDEIGQLFAY